MPRMTAKYRAALERVNHPQPQPEAEVLYAHLQQAGWFWNSEAKAWEYHDPAQAHPPSQTIAVRVWAAKEHAEPAGRAVAHALNMVYGWRLAEMSEPYPCRPPKQLEARVYLKFLPKE